jgi:hypothetical protein
MNSPPPRPLSSVLPELFRRRGGPVLEALLAAVDAEWARLWKLQSIDTTSLLIARAQRLGYGALLATAGNTDLLAAPHQLADLPLRGGGPDRAAAFWLACLFGARLKNRTTTRGASSELPPRVRATVAGNPQHRDRAFRALRLLWPAHWAFEPTDLTWEEGSDQ